MNFHSELSHVYIEMLYSVLENVLGTVQDWVALRIIRALGNVM